MTTTVKTALNVMGITEDQFKALYLGEDGRDIAAVSNALAVVAEKGGESAKTRTICEAIGITEKTFSKLDRYKRNNLITQWVYLQDAEGFDRDRQAREDAKRESLRLDFYARVGMTAEKYDALDDAAKTGIVQAFAAADAAKSQAVEEQKARTFRAGAFAAALALTGVFGAFAAMEIFQPPSAPNVTFSCADLTPEQCNERMKAVSEVIRSYKGEPAR